MISKAVLDELMKQAAAQAIDIQAELVKRRRRSGRGEREVLDIAAEEMAERWCAELDRAGIDKGVFMSFVPESVYFRELIAARRDRLFACCTMDPTDHRAPRLLESEIQEAGFVGVKLYPTNQCYRLSDVRARPFFEKARELKIPVAIHYGVSVAPTSNLGCANPIDLHPVARDFPEIPFIIAHFGAGYFRQVLELYYHCDNVYVDSSGTNNWRRCLPYEMSLRDVFVKCVDVMGPDHIIYGSDSGGVPSSYRDWVLVDQRDIVENRLGLTDGEKGLILRGNAERLYRL